MRRSPLSRLTGLVLAMLVALSAPGLALAHGYAHHEATEHARHEHGHGHHHSGAETPGTSFSADDAPSVEPGGDSGDHAHPRLSPGLSARADFPFVVPSPAISLPEYVLIQSRASPLSTEVPPRARPPCASPRQPRAPPLA